MKNKWVKRQHRKMNREIRRVNKTLWNDELWLGRFYVKQERIGWIEPFSDGSGGIFYVEMLAIDKKTGMTYSFMINNFNYLGMLFCELNKFIVQIVNVWKENPKPSVLNAEDYRDKA